MMASRGANNFYGQDPRFLPAFSLAEGAHYLDLPIATLRSWTVGRAYPVKEGKRFFAPIVLPPQKETRQLSFVNVVEAHMLDAIRRQHRVPLAKVRSAIAYLRRAFESQHPLAEHKLETDGCDLFVRELGKLVNASREGQLAMRELLEVHLRRIEWDEQGLASRLFPFTGLRKHEAARVVVMDPRISFGRPVIAGTGIATAVIADRYKAGETMEELAQDYGRDRLEIEEAIRCELRVEAA